MIIPTANISKLYSEDVNLKKCDVEALLDWASKQLHLPKVSELQAILFLQSCYYSNEAAKVAMDNFFTLRTLCPDIFSGRDPKNDSVQAALKCSMQVFLSNLTPEGYQVLWCRFADANPNIFNFCNQIRYFDMIEMLQLQEFGPQQGLVLVLDMTGATLSHFAKMTNIMVIKKFLYYLQDAMPIRLKAFHYINVAPFLDKLMALTKPFMKKEMMNMIQIHAKSMDSFYKQIPKSIVPADYGGDGESLNILHEKTKKRINDNGDFFRYEETQIVDETKRIGKPKNAGDYFGVEGSFKKLDVD